MYLSQSGSVLYDSSSSKSLQLYFDRLYGTSYDNLFDSSEIRLFECRLSIAEPFILRMHLVYIRIKYEIEYNVE